MAIINLKDISVGFGTPLLFEGVNLQVEEGERVCLVGRNGAGKSTLLKIMGAESSPDGGEIFRKPGSRTAMLSQEVPSGMEGTVFDVVAGGLGRVFGLLTEYHRISALLEKEHTESLMAELERVHHALEAAGGWEPQQRIDAAIARLKLQPDAEFSGLSGGLKRRTLLARALASEPDLLLLDEPTNHLDMESIGWLEEFLLNYRGTLIFITHDRMLQQKLATRIIELDRGRLLSWPGDYRTYLEKKEAALDAEAKENALFDKKLAQEEAWIRQGIKARRTRNEGRVRALMEMRRKRRERREDPGGVKMEIQEAERSGRLVIEAKGVSFSYGDAPVIKGLSTAVMRGDKAGVIGPNGAGKTTLLKILLGGLVPTEGTVKLGTRLEVAYFDQHRETLDGEKTVMENINEGREFVTINGVSRHVIGYLQDFLFTPDRARTPVKVLSGGERNRLLLARLFTRPSNMLVMDEPTNDLDAETLELLEELLAEYQGTVLVVSHDRAFLNNICTVTLAFEGNGAVNEYVGGYDDWLRQREAQAQPKTAKKEEKAEKPRPQKERAAKLGFKEKRELEELPGMIESLEAEQKAIYEKLADPAFYQNGGEEIGSSQARLKAVEDELERAYARWEELESLK